jgi:hypothetical protein
MCVRSGIFQQIFDASLSIICAVHVFCLVIMDDMLRFFDTARHIIIRRLLKYDQFCIVHMATYFSDYSMILRHRDQHYL